MDAGKRVVSLAFLAVFTLGTLVQYNDPDPEVYVANRGEAHTHASTRGLPFAG